MKHTAPSDSRATTTAARIALTAMDQSRQWDRSVPWHLGTVNERAACLAACLPRKVTACADLALWVWVGGDLPKCLSVNSDTRFSTPVLGRRLRSFDRSLSRFDVCRVAGLKLTSPARTACDVLTGDDAWTARARSRLFLLMLSYGVSASDCRRMLGRNPRWPGYATALRRLKSCPVPTQSGACAWPSMQSGFSSGTAGTLTSALSLSLRKALP